MTAALACAPLKILKGLGDFYRGSNLIPPNPEVTKTLPANDSTPKYLRPAFITVI
jgi:hypothetical protein